MSARWSQLVKSSETPVYGREDPYRLSVLAARLRDVPGRESNRRGLPTSTTPEPQSARKALQQSAAKLPEIPRSSSVPRDLRRANLSAVEAFRAMLQQRYGRRGNLKMVFNEWDRGRLGYLRAEDVQHMAGKFGINLSLEESTLFIASANKSKSGVLSLEEFLELVRTEDQSPTAVTQDADFDSVRASLENRAAGQREAAMHSFLRQKVKSRLHYLTQAMLRKDRDGRGVIAYHDFLQVVDSLKLPAESVSPQHWEKFYQAEGGTAQGIDYRAFAQSMRSDESPERVKNPLVDTYQRRLGNTPSPPQTEQSVVLDGRVVPVHTLELLQSKARRLKRLLKGKYRSPEDLRQALCRVGSGEGVPLEALRRFLSQEAEDCDFVSRNDVEAFLSTVQYSAYGIADVNAVVRTTFIEEYRDESLTRRTRALPPAKAQNSATAALPSHRLQELLRELEEKLYAQRCRQAFQAFRYFDTDADGYVSREDFARGLLRLNIAHVPSEAEQLLDFLDENHNGFLSYQEFANGLKLDSSNPHPSVLHSAKDLYQRHSDAFRTPERRETKPEPIPRPLLRPPDSVTREVFHAVSTHAIDESARFQQKNLQPISLASEDRAKRNRAYAAKLQVMKDHRERQNDAIAQLELQAEEQRNRKIWHKANAVETYEKVNDMQRCRIFPL